MHSNGLTQAAVELSADQRRQLVDVRQVYEAWRTRHDDFGHRFAGSVRWVTRRGHEYLHRKISDKERSLGRRSPQTELTYNAFLTGRAQAKEQLQRLARRLDEMAPVNRALQLGRVPRLFARVLRRLDDHGLLGTHLLVVGTHALFAYEAAAGVQVRAGLLATTDADLLWDARQRLTLVLPEARRDGVLGLLQRVDRSFQLRNPHDFRASNADGFWIDLIRPQDRSFLSPSARSTLGDNPADLHAAPVHGLHWLLNVPKCEVVTVGEDGYPLRLVTLDARAFALHKRWLAQRKDRDPVKAGRDLEQAAVAAFLCQRYLAQRFDDAALQGLPLALRELAGELAQVPAEPDDRLEPQW